MKLKLFLFSLMTLMMAFGTKGLKPLPVEANGSYSITYELFGGTNDVDNPTTYNPSSNIVLEAASKPGLTFGGWYASFNFEPNSLVTALPDGRTGNLTLYARWAPLAYSVTFEENGGEEIPNGDVPADYLFNDNSYEYRYNSPVVTGVYKILAADLNLDGYDDFIQVSNGTAQYVTYMSNGAAGGFTPTATSFYYNSGSNWMWDVEYVDLDSDGWMDLIFCYEQYSGGDSITWRKGTAVGTFDAETVLPIASGGIAWGAVISMDFGDINYDQLLDIVLANGGDFAYLINQGNGTFGPLTKLNQSVLGGGTYTRYAYLVDMNDDGYLDFIGHKEETGYLYLSDGSTVFTGNPFTFGAGAYNGFASDKDGDGKKEYYVKASGWSGVFLFTFNETFTGVTQSFDLISPQGGFFGNFFDFDFKDVNSDGLMDPLYMSTNGMTYFLKSNADGTYQWQQQFIGNYFTGAILFNRVDGSYYFVGHEFTNGYTNIYGLANVRYTTPLYGTTTTREGYTFDGWYLDNDEWENPFNFYGNTIAENVTLYAKWTLNQYTVTYYLNGGTNNNTNPTTLNINSPTYTLAEPSKEHAIFLGWYDNSDFEGDPVTSIPAGTTEEVSLYAKWNNALTVTYNTNGGTAVPKEYVFKGEAITVPNDPTRIGYTFGGWFANAGLTQPFGFGLMPENNLTVYAKWIVNQYTISFVSNGGTALEDLTLNYQAAIALSSNPERLGYNFLGWFTDEALNNPFTLTAMPAYDLTLYAKWVIRSFVLTYDVEGVLNQVTITYNAPIASSLPTPTKYGHEFVGWELDGELIDVSSFLMPTEAITLVAVFRDNVIPVVFTVTDGETYSTSIEIIFNEGSATLNGQPVTSGTLVEAPGTYELIVTDADGNQRVVTFTIASASDAKIPLYATYAVVFTLGIGFLGFMAVRFAVPEVPSTKGKE